MLVMYFALQSTPNSRKYYFFEVRFTKNQDCSTLIVIESEIVIYSNFPMIIIP